MSLEYKDTTTYDNPQSNVRHLRILLVKVSGSRYYC